MQKRNMLRILILCTLGTLVAPQIVFAQPILIDFNNPSGLRNATLYPPGVDVGVASTFANSYAEDGMVFTDGVHPPDPALGPVESGHYHLVYEDPSVSFEFRGGKYVSVRCVGGVFMSVSGVAKPVCTSGTIVLAGDAASQPRRLTTHAPGAVVQMIYDPEGDGVPNPFNLISLQVLGGKLNVGIKSLDIGIAIYNDLTAGVEWGLIGATNLTRATLEFPVSFRNNFLVDNIVFEPVISSPPPPPSPRQSALTIIDTSSSIGFPSMIERLHNAVLPSCLCCVIIPGPPKQLQVTVQSIGSGLASIAVLTATNASVSVPPFTSGTLTPVIITATKINQSQSSTVRLRVTDVAGNAIECDPVYTTISAQIPQSFSLSANYPNPFNPTTRINFSIARAESPTFVTLKVFDILGREVRTLFAEPMQAGEYSVEWDGKNELGKEVPSGVYLYRMIAGEFNASRRMTLMK